MQVNKEQKEAINNRMERYIKNMIWHVDGRCPSDVLETLEKVPASLSEFSACACNELDVLCERYWGNHYEIESTEFDDSKTAYITLG